MKQNRTLNKNKFKKTISKKAEADFKLIMTIILALFILALLMFIFKDKIFSATNTADDIRDNTLCSIDSYVCKSSCGSLKPIDSLKHCCDSAKTQGYVACPKTMDDMFN